MMRMTMMMSRQQRKVRLRRQERDCRFFNKYNFKLNTKFTIKQKTNISSNKTPNISSKKTPSLSSTKIPNINPKKIAKYKLKEQIPTTNKS